MELRLNLINLQNLINENLIWRMTIICYHDFRNVNKSKNIDKK